MFDTNIEVINVTDTNTDVTLPDNTNTNITADTVDTVDEHLGTKIM